MRCPCVCCYHYAYEFYVRSVPHLHLGHRVHLLLLVAPIIKLMSRPLVLNKTFRTACTFAGLLGPLRKETFQILPSTATTRTVSDSLQNELRYKFFCAPNIAEDNLPVDGNKNVVVCIPLYDVGRVPVLQIFLLI